MIRTIALTCIALGLCACAETGREHATAAAYGYDHDQNRLQRECEARGGFLVPTGHLTGRPETENYCRIEGQPNRP